MSLLRLVRALRTSGFDIEADELADIIWLANQLPVTKQHDISKNMQQTKHNEKKTSDFDVNLSDRVSNKSPAKIKKVSPTVVELKETPARAGVYVPPNSNVNTGGLSLNVAGVTALSDKMALGRALRPLLRRAPSQYHFELDEEATVHRIADTQVWLPVMRPNLTHWLELDVIIDEWPSIVLWREAIAELIALLTNMGAFRSVQTWSLWTSSDGGKVEFRTDWGAAAQNKPERPPKELVSIRGNRLVLVLSDGISPAWYNGTIARLMNNWVQSEMVVLLHLLPYQYWRRTGLINAIPAYFRARSPGIPNTQLTAISSPESSEQLPKRGYLPIPTLPLDPRLIASWAQAITGGNNIWIPGMMLPLDAKREDERQEQIKAEQQGVLSEEQDQYTKALNTVERYRKSASPEAWKLAGYLSATVPLGLPLMRLVQEVMLPNSSREHMAEFYLSGLIQRVEGSDYLSDEGARYEFVPGVRRILLSSIGRDEAAEVIQQTSQYISRESGKVIDFKALVADPRRVSEIKTDAIPFATLTQNVLRTLGGEYAVLADSLSRSTIKDDEEDLLQKDKSGDAETVQITQETDSFTHRIEKGETISSIAIKYGTNSKSILDANSQLLRLGYQLFVPDITSYVIKEGDTLSSIAIRHKTTVNSIRAQNPQITNSNLISVGQVIKIPKKEPGSYTIRKSDTFVGLANRFRTSVDELLALNPNFLRVGAELSIPVSDDQQELDMDNYLDTRRETRYGVPAADQILINRHFIIGYSYYFRQAKWALETVDPDKVDVERFNNFRPDSRIPEIFRTDFADFRGSGYDRGHLVASASQTEEQIQNSETFLLSNTCPMQPLFNRRIWRDLENAIRILDAKREVLETLVISGPIFNFDIPIKTIMPKGRRGATLPIPHAFFKSILIEDNKGRLRMWSFLVPNQETKYPLEHFLVPTRTVERYSGILLWEKLSNKEIEREKGMVRSMWSS